MANVYFNDGANIQRSSVCAAFVKKIVKDHALRLNCSIWTVSPVKTSQEKKIKKSTVLVFQNMNYMSIV